MKKIILFLAIAANLALLVYFKYFNFLIDSINGIFGGNIYIVEIILPIGISFFTFQGMSYVIDVYRGIVPARSNIFKLGLYIVLFPQLIAGPIVRYKDIAADIDNNKVSTDDFCVGIERFIIGLGKKAVIANTMASIVDKIWENGALGNFSDVAWLGSIAYTLQIYFDFSGYSDMAIGLGRMFGFHFNENFNLPYISKSISEFWRRWHISLSSWFKDYVYIPLGGNRKNVYLNLAIVFILTGLWHGASWHFLIWGIWNGIFILAERFLGTRIKAGSGNGSKRSLPGEIIMSIYTLFVVNIGWVLFRAPDTGSAIEYIMIMFGIRRAENVGYTASWYLNGWTVTILIIAVLLSSSIPVKAASVLKRNFPDKVFMAGKYILLLMVFYLSLIRIVSGTYNPFIYFQF